MKSAPTVGVMGSAAAIDSTTEGERLRSLARALGQTIGERKLTLFTGATTGLVYEVGKSAHEHGARHIGISPGSSQQEHIERYKLPIDACDAIVYTGFGLKGRNVVLVRSCDIVIFISGGMGSLNEFTVAHDEERIIGCYLGTGGVADESRYLLERFSTRKNLQLVVQSDPARMLEACIKLWETTSQ